MYAVHVVKVYATKTTYSFVLLKIYENFSLEKYFEMNPDCY